MKLILTIILMSGYVHTFEMNDVHYNAYNCDKFITGVDYTIMVKKYLLTLAFMKDMT